MIRLGIIEDDEEIRKSVEMFFSSLPGYEFVISANSVESFFQYWEDEMHFDVILSDIGLPGVSGIEGVRMIKAKSPKTNVIMLSIYNDSENIFQSLCAGAVGYIEKGSSLNKVKEAIQVVYDGGGYMTPSIAKKIAEYFNPPKSKKFKNELTQRETQVLHLIQNGLNNKEIAETLNISIDTTKTHIKKIYLKLEVNNRMDIVKGKFK